MRSFASVVLIVGSAACVAGACNGRGDRALTGLSRLLAADRRTVTVTSGKSVEVTASLRDAQGSLLAVGDAEWTVSDSTIAVVAPDTQPIPGPYETRATITGRAVTGGWAWVVVVAGGAVDSIAVVVIPRRFAGSLVGYAGTPRPDTVVTPAAAGPPPIPGDTVVFSAPDTLVLNGTDLLQFDTVLATVYVHTAAGLVYGVPTSRTPGRLTEVFSAPASGRLVVRGLRFLSGDSLLGAIPIDSLVGDSVAVARQRFHGTIAVVGDTMNVIAEPGTSFDAWTSVTLDTSQAAVMSRTASEFRVLSREPFTGYVTVSGVEVIRAGPLYGRLFDLKSTSVYSLAEATFPGTIVTGGRLLDTVTVRAAANAKFNVGYYGGFQVTVRGTYPCDGCQYAVLWVLRSSDSLKFLAPVAVHGPIWISAVSVGSATLPMYSSASLDVSGDTTGEVNEPGNDSAGGATALTGGSGYYEVFGALNGSTDTTDYYTFQVPAAAQVSIGLTSVGSGLSVYLCDSLASGACGPATDLLQGAGSALLPPGPAWVRVALRTPQAGYLAYDVAVVIWLTGVRSAPDSTRSAGTTGH